MRLVDPPKLVTVRRDDRWCDGGLRAWRRDDVGWRGFVCYGAEPGLRWLEWIDAEQMREDVGRSLADICGHSKPPDRTVTP
jgi:hypothetical protein